MIALLLTIPEPGLGQELPLLNDHPGSFEILSRTDYVNPACGFAKAEIAANLREIAGLVEMIRRNPVLSNIKGFDGRARIYDVGCEDNSQFGIPARISFEFCSWYTKKDGTPERGTIEPPCWSLFINKLRPTVDRTFSADDFQGESQYFMVPAKKKALQPGIDVYGDECYVIFEDGRPPYWLPVTVDEAFNAIKASWKKTETPVVLSEMLKYLESEYAAIPASDRSRPAHYGGGGTVSVVSANGAFPALVRINPQYWDTTLPKSAIQFLYFQSAPDKDKCRRLKEESLAQNSIDYNLYRFLETFDDDDIRALVGLIGR